MTAFYADYIANLRALLSELDRRPERFQTFDVRLELVAGGSLFVYETKRRKGQTDRMYYGRSATGASQQISQASAFLAIDRFFSLGQFLALTRVTNGRSGSSVIDTRYPHCAVNFSYRKKWAASRPIDASPTPESGCGSYYRFPEDMAACVGGQYLR